MKMKKISSFVMALTVAVTMLFAVPVSAETSAGRAAVKDKSICMLNTTGNKRLNIFLPLGIC